MVIKRNSPMAFIFARHSAYSRLVSHAAIVEKDRLALRFASGQTDANPLRWSVKGLSIKTGRPAPLDKRTRPFEVFAALVGRDYDRVHLPNNIGRFTHYIWDEGRLGHQARRRGIFTPDMGDASARNTQGRRRLAAQILGNCRIWATSPSLAAYRKPAIEDGAPTVGMTIAFHHSHHAELYITSIFNQLLHAERSFAFVAAETNPPTSRNAINKNERTVCR